MANNKSDLKAKAEFIKYLHNKGFQAKVASTPADIVATKDGQTWYYEIKKTKRTDTYFGGATLTEWVQAILDPGHFRYVVAKTDEAESFFEFQEYTPEEFMEFSTIPPFKIFFNINLSNNERKPRRKTTKKATRLTKENLEVLSQCYNQLKK